MAPRACRGVESNVFGMAGSDVCAITFDFTGGLTVDVRRPVRSLPVHRQRRCVTYPDNYPKLHARAGTKRRPLGRVDETNAVYAKPY